jgi:hypothetical protein
MERLFLQIRRDDSLRYLATRLPAGLTIDPITGVISRTVSHQAAETEAAIRRS